MKEQQPSDHIETLRFLERREQEKQRALDERFSRAWQDFDRIITYIVSHHHPRRIWQWGSLLDRKRFGELSDLDIAIEGLGSASELFEILAHAEEISDFPIDIIELEKTAPEYRQLIKRKGRLVHGSA